LARRKKLAVGSWQLANENKLAIRFGRKKKQSAISYNKNSE
jgi:hypothetical protein